MRSLARRSDMAVPPKVRNGLGFARFTGCRLRGCPAWNAWPASTGGVPVPGCPASDRGTTRLSFPLASGDGTSRVKASATAWRTGTARRPMFASSTSASKNPEAIGNSAGGLAARTRCTRPCRPRRAPAARRGRGRQAGLREPRSSARSGDRGVEAGGAVVDGVGGADAGDYRPGVGGYRGRRDAVEMDLAARDEVVVGDRSVPRR